MDLHMHQQKQLDESQEKNEIREAVAQGGKLANPVLHRLQARVLRGLDASEVITSYDRMHHRHNRS